MDPRQNREWMYAGRKSPWEFSDEWRDKAEEFVNKAFDISSRPMKVFCPCSKCDNRRRQSKVDVSTHLIKNGFTPFYHVWNYHGEQLAKRLRTEPRQIQRSVLRRFANCSPW